MAATCTYNVFVGAETGLLKGIQVAERTWQNLNAVESSNRSREITSLCWGNAEKTKLCAGLRDNCVLTFDSSGSSAREDGPFFGAAGHIKIISMYEGRFLTGFNGGSVAVWSGGENEQSSFIFSTGDNLWAMASCFSQTNLLATGGKENPLKIWDLNATDKPIFMAKNVKNDWLNLRVPVWVTKVQFLQGTSKVVTGTGYNQIRVYDSNAQKRPVIDFNFLTYPVTGLSVCPLRDDQILVSNTFGDLGLLDLRKKQTVHLYKGFSGGITDVACHDSTPVVVTCSIDRYVRVHEINSKVMLNSFYLKSRLNCVLLSNDWPDSDDKEKLGTGVISSSSKVNEAVDSTAGSDDIWDSLDVVKTKTVKDKFNKLVHKRKADDNFTSDVFQKAKKTLVKKK